MAKNQKKPSKSLLAADPILVNKELGLGAGNVNQMYEEPNISNPPTIADADVYRERIKNWRIPLRIPRMSEPSYQTQDDKFAIPQSKPYDRKLDLEKWTTDAYTPNDNSRPLEEKRMEYANRLAAKLKREGIDDANALINIMANVQHESAYDNTKRENINYSANRMLEVFPKKFGRKVIGKTSDGKNIWSEPTQSARAEAAQLQKQGRLAVAQKIYGKRMGNSEEFDAVKYRGRGSIQLTGKNNYTLYSKLLSEKLGKNIDLVAHPELINQDPELDAELTIQYFLHKVGKNNLSNLEKTTKGVGAATDPKPRYDTARNLEQWYQQEYLPSLVKPKSPPASTPVPKYKEANQRAQDAMFEELLGGGR